MLCYCHCYRGRERGDVLLRIYMTPALVSDYNTRKMRRRERKSDITKRKLHDPTAGRIGRAPRQNRGQRVSCLIFANHFISCRHYNYLLSFLRGSYFARCRSCGGPSACLGGGQRASGSYRALLCVFVCVLLKLYEGTWNVRIKGSIIIEKHVGYQSCVVLRVCL